MLPELPPETKARRPAQLPLDLPGQRGQLAEVLRASGTTAP